MNTLNFKYKCLHGFYWMLYCLPTGFITLFMLSYGVSASSIGIITAISSILAAAGQLAVGNIVDSCRKISWKTLLLIICAIQALILLTLLFSNSNKLISTALFPGFMVLMYLQMPLVNASIFYYTSRGLSLDFGSARGTGSLTYAFISFVCGQLVAFTGEIAIIYLSILTLLGLILTTALMPTIKEYTDQKTEETHRQPTKRKVGIISFVKKYPKFTLVLVGSIFLMSFHNITHTYMIQMIENIGGNSASMGTAFSIEAISELPIMFGFYKLIQKIPINKLMIIAGIAFVFKSLAYLCAVNVLTLYIAQVLQMLSYAIFASASVYFANEKMEEEDKVTGQSYMTATMSIGAVAGNFVGGLVLDAFGIHALLIICVMITIIGASVTFVGARNN